MNCLFRNDCAIVNTKIFQHSVLIFVRKFSLLSSEARCFKLKKKIVYYVNIFLARISLFTLFCNRAYLNLTHSVPCWACSCKLPELNITRQTSTEGIQICVNSPPNSWILSYFVIKTIQKIESWRKRRYEFFPPYWFLFHNQLVY